MDAGEFLHISRESSEVIREYKYVSARQLELCSYMPIYCRTLACPTLFNYLLCEVCFEAICARIYEGSS